MTSFSKCQKSTKTWTSSSRYSRPCRDPKPIRSSALTLITRMLSSYAINSRSSIRLIRKAFKRANSVPKTMKMISHTRTTTSSCSSRAAELSLASHQTISREEFSSKTLAISINQREGTLNRHQVETSFSSVVVMV